MEVMVPAFSRSSDRPTQSVVKPAASWLPFTSLRVNMSPTVNVAGSIMELSPLPRVKRQPAPERDRMGCTSGSLELMALFGSYSWLAMATAVADTVGFGGVQVRSCRKVAVDCSEVCTFEV